MLVIRTSSARSHLCAAIAFVVALCTPTMAYAQQSLITGRVVSKATGLPLAQTSVYLIGTTITASTNSEGRFTMRASPGEYEVRVLRLGYTEQKKVVTVTAARIATLDFTMEVAAIVLTDVVTTATGDQRRVELGHSVQSLGDIDKRVERSPNQNIVDLIVGKAPGVVVLPATMVGAAPTIRIRGIRSLPLPGAVSSDPIYVVDGIRMNSNSITVLNGGVSGSMLNTLNPEDIASIEIVKGSSAATLYGTDAANGVVVITTKKGTSGATRYTMHSGFGVVSDNGKYLSQWANWGHDPATNVLKRCVLVTIAAGSCVSDSVTHWSALTDPNYTSISNGSVRQVGGSLSGGTEAVRYFLSADFDGNRGPVAMPKFAQHYFDSLGTPMREEWLHPLNFDRTSLRANVNMAVNPNVDVAVTTSYVTSSQRDQQEGNNALGFLYQAANGPGLRPSAACQVTPANCLGYSNTGALGEELGGYSQYSPGQLFQYYNNLAIDRFLMGTTTQWRPFSWMHNDAIVGLDWAKEERYNLCRYGECQQDNATTRLGKTGTRDVFDRNLTVRLASTSNWHVRSGVLLKTTIGADYVNQATASTGTNGTTLSPGAQSTSQAATRSGSGSLQASVKTLGYYIDESIALRDRLYINLALRTDQNSAFGSRFQKVVYPKAGISYIISDEDFFPKTVWLDYLRLRSAYGASGVQPSSTQALQILQATTTNLPTSPVATVGVESPGLVVSTLGNPDLKPERSTEREFGFEAKVLKSRVDLDVTYYKSISKDGLVAVPVASSSGAAELAVTRNMASVQNSGFEATVTTTLLRRNAITWDLTLGGSTNMSKVLSLGYDAQGNPLPTIGTGTQRTSVGGPIVGTWGRPYTYSDANGDGILAPSEVTVDSVYVSRNGSAIPSKILSVQNGISLFKDKLRFDVSLDYKGDFFLQNFGEMSICNTTSNCAEQVVAGTSLELQARAIANRYGTPVKSPWGYWERVWYWRLRDISATYTLPAMLSSRMHARDASLTLSARNLHIWTNYTGADPEAAANNANVQFDYMTGAPPTTLLFRLNLHF